MSDLERETAELIERLPDDYWALDLSEREELLALHKRIRAEYSDAIDVHGELTERFQGRDQGRSRQLIDLGTPNELAELLVAVLVRRKQHHQLAVGSGVCCCKQFRAWSFEPFDPPPRAAQTRKRPRCGGRFRFQGTTFSLRIAYSRSPTASRAVASSG